MLFEDGVDTDNPLYSEAWIAQYRQIGEALDETGLLTRGGAVVHRNDDGEPYCYGGDKYSWTVVDTEEARKSGYIPCEGCYGGVLDYLADREHSRVTHAGEAVDEDATPSGLAADGGVAAVPSTLTSRTEEVLVTTGNNKVYHAPTGGREPLCDYHGEFRLVDRATLAGHRRPCVNCFEVDEVDTDSP